MADLAGDTQVSSSIISLTHPATPPAQPAEDLGMVHHGQIKAGNVAAGLTLKQPSPTRQSSRKSSAAIPASSAQPSTQNDADLSSYTKEPAATKPAAHLPTPLSNSPSGSSTYRYPPQFQTTHTAHRPHGHSSESPYPLSQQKPVSVSCTSNTAASALAQSHPYPTRAQYPSAAQFTPQSPYRPGEYARRLTSANDRTRIERRLFDDEDEGMRTEDEDMPKRNRGSSPLQPAFEARLILRKGAPVDLISWLRRNFHHIPSPSHPSLTSSTSLLAIRALLAERFPRVPEQEELIKAVTAAFPRVQLDHGQPNSGEPPIVRGLVWNGKETVYEDREEERERERAKEREKVKEKERETREKQRRMSLDIAMGRMAQTPDRRGINRSKRPETLITTSKHGSITNQQATASRSPTQSTIVSPTSTSTRRVLPNTPARSVLEEFAELATLADKTPASKTRSLPGDVVAPAPAYALANICNSFGQNAAGDNKLKRRASGSPDRPDPSRRRASTPTNAGINGLLAAAEAVEGSPMASILDSRTQTASNGHKRRRTIGGAGAMKEVLNEKRNKGHRGVGTVSPAIGRGGWLPGVAEAMEVDAEGASVDDAERLLLPPTQHPSKPEKQLEGGNLGLAGMIPVSGKYTDSSSSQASVSAASIIVPGMTPSQMMKDPSSCAHPPRRASPSLAPPPLSFVQPSTPSTLTTAMPQLPMDPSSQSSTPVSKLAKSTTLTTGKLSKQTSSAAPRIRKANELPTDGAFPGIDCKPPHPYHEMIRYAIENAPDQRLQLSQIYSTIADRFPFFKTLDEKKTAGWQNSIRHNLSLKKMFVRVNKVDGIPDEGGKGGWWTVQPDAPDEGRPGRKVKNSSTVSVNGVIVDTLSADGSVAGSSRPIKGRRSDDDLSVVSGMIGVERTDGTDKAIHRDAIATAGNMGGVLHGAMNEKHQHGWCEQALRVDETRDVWDEALTRPALDTAMDAPPR